MKKLVLIITLSISIYAPSQALKHAQPSNATTLVALKLPNNKPGDIARELTSYAKNIQQQTEKDLNNAGLKLALISAEKLHVTLFDGPIPADDIIKLAAVIQENILALSHNSFYPIRFQGIKIMGNSIVVEISGQGDTQAKDVARNIDKKMGSIAKHPYVGHISIARIKLTSQKSGAATTQADKDQIERILKQNPKLERAVTSIPFTNSKPFGLFTISITQGGGPGAKEIAQMQIREIKKTTTDQSLVSKAYAFKP